MQSWFYLTAAIFLEVAGTISMKLSEGFTKIIPSILIFIFYGLSFSAFSIALKRIEVSIAYAIWAGVGSALITIIGVVYFKESFSFIKIASIALIIIGVVGLNISGLER
jgi:small multidrug resistance pump